MKKSKEIIPFPLSPFTLKPWHSFPHIRYILRFCLTENRMRFEASFSVGIIADFPTSRTCIYTDKRAKTCKIHKFSPVCNFIIYCSLIKYGFQYRIFTPLLLLIKV